jgi:membrane protein
MLFAFSVLGTLLTDKNFAESVYKGLSILLANSDVIEWLRNEVLDTLIASRGATTITGAIALLFISVGMFRSLEYAMNHVFGIRPRSYIKSYLIGISVSLIMNTLLQLGVVMAPVFNLLSTSRNVIIQKVLSNPWLTFTFDWVTSVLIFTIVCLILYYILPNTRQRFRDVFLGALSAGLLWEVLKILFSWYLSYFSNITSWVINIW